MLLIYQLIILGSTHNSCRQVSWTSPSRSTLRNVKSSLKVKSKILQVTTKLVFTSILQQNQGTTDERKEFNPSKMKLRTYRQRFTFTHTDHSLKSGSDLDDIRSIFFVKITERINCVRMKLVQILTDTDHLISVERIKSLPELSNNDQDIVDGVHVVIDDHENSLR